MTEIFAFTIAEAAKASGIGRSTLYELIGTGKLEARKVGNRTLVVGASLRSFLDNLPLADIKTGRKSAA
jgi:excisionase family DNA binding protein